MTVKNKILTSTTQTPRQQTNKQTNKQNRQKQKTKSQEGNHKFAYINW